MKKKIKMKKDFKRLCERTDNIDFLRESYIYYRTLQDDKFLQFIFSIIGLGEWWKKRYAEEIQCLGNNIYRIAQAKRDKQKEIDTKLNSLTLNTENNMDIYVAVETKASQENNQEIVYAFSTYEKAVEYLNWVVDESNPQSDEWKRMAPNEDDGLAKISSAIRQSTIVIEKVPVDYFKPKKNHENL